MDTAQFVLGFRRATPYLNAHRGKIVVLCFDGDALESAHLPALIHDIAVLHSLGLKLVLVHGARPQIEARLRQAGLEPRYVDGRRLTDEQAMGLIRDVVGGIRVLIEALLSQSMAETPMFNQRLRVLSGNFVTAKPLGIYDGVDYGYTGEIRRIDKPGLLAALDAGNVVLLSPLGYSPTGEMFNLPAEEVATVTAIALRADKLILLREGTAICDETGARIGQFRPQELEKYLAHHHDLSADLRRHLQYALHASQQQVRRVHLLSRHIDGGLLLELFTRDGVGTLVTHEGYDRLRAATIEDVGGILALIKPLEEDGTLVRRSRERLETEIDHFCVMERDNMIIGCAALYPFAAEAVGELACVAIHADYRNGGRAEALLRYVERQAHKQHLRRLFVLTTRTAHWFRERGFAPAQLEDLPVARVGLYNYQRRSQVFVKVLDP